MPLDEMQQVNRKDEKWTEIRNRLLANFPVSFHPDKTVELLDLCRVSDKLRHLFPHISLGRLGLERQDVYETGKPDDFVCLYFYEGHYTVSSHDNEEKRFFDTAATAVAFVEQHLQDENPFT